MSAPVRRLGPFAVSAIGLGCMNLSHAYGTPPDQADAGLLLNRALDLGCTLLDTAAIYGGGRNEALIGRAVGHRRGEFTLASKCVLDLVDGRRVLDGRPEAIRASCERSLTRLRTDRIDLFYLHRLDPRVPVEESVGAVSALIGAGKVRALGLSEMSAATIARAHAVQEVAAVQSEYSLAVRNPEIAVLDLCARAGIGFVAFSPLARGLLADGLPVRLEEGDLRRSMPRFIGERLVANRVLARRFGAIAARAGFTPAELALAWLLARHPFIVPIPGTTRIDHLDQNLAAASRPVPAALLDEADRLLGPNVFTGARYSAEAQRQIDSELLPGEELAG